ncbi:trace amine-associated receptor 13c-like, partial [Carassius gibelio]|uniref:trace amine-associated receptor 13c-like n=1 Tax=Carassius gibelio TaxID=101364 RepID=UPI002277A4EC
MVYETEDHEIQYCFPAINSSCIRGKHFRHESNILYMFFSLLSVWTVFLNLLVIISISHFKKLHTPTNLIILSLAVADMLVGFVMPIEASRQIEICWYFGETFCGVFLVITGLLISASLYNFTLIAVDRYVAVCHPLLYQKKITTTKTLIIICICWVWSSAYNISFITDNGYFDPSSRTHGCYGECPFMANSAWNMTDLFLSFLFPCTVIIILYLK